MNACDGNLVPLYLSYKKLPITKAKRLLTHPSPSLRRQNIVLRSSDEGLVWFGSSRPGRMFSRMGIKTPVRGVGSFYALTAAFSFLLFPECGASSALPNLEASVYHDALCSESAHAREHSARTTATNPQNQPPHHCPSMRRISFFNRFIILFSRRDM